MEESRLRQNPRNPAFLSDLSSQKPSPPILERFRSLLKQIQDQIRPTSSDGDDDDTLPRPEMDEIVRLYEDVLSELTYNSKPIITDLTIIAGEQKEYGEGIADAICRRIVEVPAEQKLPSLYLLDSIVKNIGRNYVRYFAARLSEVFCEAYKQVHPSQYPSMRHLFGTWSTVFPPSILRKIESELQFSSAVSHQTSSWTASRPSESPSPRPAHGIHVNPKYLEARRQFEHSTVMHETDPSDNARIADFGGKGMERNASSSPKGWSGASPKFHDVQNERGVSSSLQAYGRKPTIGYIEHEFEHAEALLPPQTAARSASLVTGSESKLAPPKSKGLRASSATGIGQTRPLSPRSNGFARDISPGIVERASPSHSGFLSRLGRVNDRDGERSESWEGNWSDGGSQQVETSSPYALRNGYEQRPPRALIDAYGNYRGKDTLQEKLSTVERLDVNGNSKKTNRKWQNIEEEEYDWEDMSPTPADRSRGNDLIASDFRASLKRPNAALLEPEFRSNCHSQAQLSQLGRESMTTKSLSTVTQNGSLPHFEAPYQTREPWNLSHRFSQSSNPYLTPQSRAALQMPFSASGMVPSAGQKISPLDSKLEAEAPVWSFPTIQSRMGYSNPGTSNLAVLSSAAPASTMEKHLAQRPHSPPITQHMRPPLHNSLPPPLVHSLPHRAQFDLLDVNRLSVNHGPNKSLILSRPQFDAADRTSLNSSTLLQFPQQQAGLVSLIRPPSQEHAALPPAPASHLVAQTLNHGPMQGQGSIRNAIFPNPFPGISSSSVTIHSIPGTSFHVPGGALPPLPPGPPPVSSQMGPTSQNTGPIISNHPPGSAFSGLIGSLMAQGLISLTAPAAPQDSVGLEFNSELLKVRHESAINALYAELPRQCTTCGQRFKSQEEHSNHMDWHVTKNRMSKNRKQKPPSRKWFVSAKEWFSGAEALGTDSVPGFLPTEAVVEKREDEETAVPADENQNVCALCGEPFDDFYSDETEEWMYKGAVYLNSQDGYTEVMDRSQLGPIVHAKCRSESTAVPTEDFEQNEESHNFLLLDY
ncbi:polyadenylation and cleavage factor homolog 4 isoform X2 [Magnolia sinica]|uniref:polyadenylation and cleavage factor homolog 4 isoform X2 n=1 Tax=Magnolia sinica TaxID=86752 RepID=UPI00265B04BA|nr:polyadenylation and cleavage factor homolog 4 isoform X2 [Magnolia sinica]